MSLSYRKLPNYKYQLTEVYIFQTSILNHSVTNHDFISLNREGLLILRKGYAWDGATYFLDLKSIMRASLVHDAILQLIHQDKLLPISCRKEADKLLSGMSKEDGMSKWLSLMVYAAVRVYAFVRHRT